MAPSGRASLGLADLRERIDGIDRGGARRTAKIEAALIERGVVVRPTASYGLPEWQRITVGTADGNRRLPALLDEVLA